MSSVSADTYKLKILNILNIDSDTVKVSGALLAESVKPTAGAACAWLGANTLPAPAAEAEYQPP